MTAQIEAIARLVTEELDHLNARAIGGGKMSQVEHRFCRLLGNLRLELGMLQLSARMEAARTAEQIVAAGTIESPERGGTGPGTV